MQIADAWSGNQTLVHSIQKQNNAKLESTWSAEKQN